MYRLMRSWLKARKADEVSVQQVCPPTSSLKRRLDQQYQKAGKAAAMQHLCAHMLADIGIERQSTVELRRQHTGLPFDVAAKRTASDSSRQR
ncbi:hypothetical protein [Brucella pseudogrignonensis]|uniref:hypothetical protein n=1 Tax=Brucella pseudogrignonensis TaxID=419475 RepID=UPI000CFB3048|nr:hypothetical protein [Brucella pseudogrignonensis]MQP40630.1 hypothetical protein [Ochrobactrum sp. MYb237]PQZ39015.1 hypothetical protein CQ059_20460 [Brucella pseudogrignonensis]PRA40802.1 hypothetical protein CQ063_09610 [Brucella pseudogrignonensis]PRA69624.1 hypothetical protein CQ055_09480 [Brucella pseudogrignonensis]